MKYCSDAHISITYEHGEQQVLLNGENVTSRLREERVGNMASNSSANPKVREKLTDLQRELARKTDVVMDGRDIGTQVLPDANTKIYLTASSAIRAKRRYLELKERGLEGDISEIEADINLRDHRDMTREIAPLQQAKDAVLLDSSDMTIDEVVVAIINIYESTKRV
jgi:cytidylate kinase